MTLGKRNIEPISTSELVPELFLKVEFYITVEAVESSAFAISTAKQTPLSPVLESKITLSKVNTPL